MDWDSPLKGYHGENISPLRFFFFASCGSFLESFFLYPIKLCKTRLQVERGGDVRFFHDLPKMFRQVKRQDGLRGLWKGYLWWQIVGLPSELVYFGAYNFTRTLLHTKVMKAPSDTPPSTLICMTAGVVADVTSTLLWVPVDVVTQRLMIQSATKSNRYKSGPHGFYLIMKEEGIRGLFKGFGASTLATAPASAVWWLTYEKMKAFLTGNKKKKNSEVKGGAVRQETKKSRLHDDRHPLVHIISGATAGFMAATISNPIDVVKVRLQTQDFIAKASTPGTVTRHTMMYKNTLQGLRIIVREEGFKALTKGMLPKILISMPASGITFVLYETVLKLSAVKRS